MEILLCLIIIFLCARLLGALIGIAAILLQTPVGLLIILAIIITSLKHGHGI